MIITCEKCYAKFNLDENLLKQTGSKVRCSKCQNIFLAYPPTEMERVAEPAEEMVGSETVSPDIKAESVEQVEVPEEEAKTALETEEEEFDLTDLNLEEGMESEPEAEKELEELLELELDTEPVAEETPEESEAALEIDEQELDLSDIEEMLDIEEKPEPEPEAEVKEESEELELEMDTEPVAKETPEEAEAVFEADEDKIELSSLDIEEEPEPEAEAKEEAEPEAEAKEEAEPEAEAKEEPEHEAEAKEEPEPEAEVKEEPEEPELELDTEPVVEETPEPEAEVKEEPEEPEAEVKEEPEEPEAEVETEEASIRTEQETTPAEKKRISTPVLIILIITLLTGGAYATYVALKSMNIKIPFISDLVEPGEPGVQDEVGNLKIIAFDIADKFIDNSKIGKLFIISGKVKNEYSGARSFIKITGKLYAKERVLSKTATVCCGNMLSDQDLSNMDINSINKKLSNLLGDNKSNVNVKPGKALPFMIVFPNISDNIEGYTVEVAASSPA